MISPSEWRCAIRNRDTQREARLGYYHRADGGYVRRRRRHLAEQREKVQSRLDDLRKEQALVPKP